MDVAALDARVTSALAGRYAIRQVIGVGGAATVYRAADLKHGRDVALKVLRPEVAASLGAERFIREIRTAARLTHPHILPLHDSGEADGLLYYVMPFVEGESLRDRIARERQMPVPDAVAIACEVAEGLDYAHGRGVVHRDVKPENVLFPGGRAALTDFGVARGAAAEDAAPLTETGLAVGTPEYMSPEACAGGEAVDGRSDEYSLACVLYEMLAGRPPFTAATPQAVLARHLADAVPPLGTVRPDAPANVIRTVMRGLGKAPADRFPTLRAFADALRSAAAEPEAKLARSVAVLPFANSGGPPEDDVLCDGITEEIINALSHLEGLRVPCRTSVFAFKGKAADVRAAGAQLHVGAVLEGTVRRAGSRLRVSVRLVNVADGYLLWSERYDREMADVFAIQDDIARCIAAAFQVLLTDDQRAALGRIPTRDIRAYEYYLRGRQFFHQARRKSLQFAEEMFRRAIALDPGYAQAWAGLADCHSLLQMYYPGTSPEPGLGVEASARALALDAALPEAHAARGFALWQARRVDEAVVELEEGRRLDPRQFEARYFLARLRFSQGDIAQAAALFEEAARAREDPEARFFAAQSYAALGRAAEAEAAYRRALHVARLRLELNPDDSRTATMCAVALCRLGERDEGLAWAQRARAIDPDDSGVLYNVACLFALEGQREEALQCLEEAFRGGFGARDWIAHDPDLESLRADPRFQALLAMPVGSASG